MESCKPVSLAYKIFEGGQDVKKNNPIIFLHGLGGSKEHWRDIPKIIAEVTYRTVYTIDARNHGDSPWIEEFNFDLNALDFMHFIEEIEAEKVTIVGHSMGGITCMKTALKMPSKIDKVIIEDIGVLIPKDILGFIKLIFSFFEEAESNIQAGSTRNEASKFISDFVYDRVPDEVKPIIKRSDAKYYELIKQSPDGYINFKANLKVIRKALENADALISEYEGVYDGPIYFIYGEKSMFPVHQDAENIRKFFPTAQFVGIENATHDVHSDAPQQFVDALLKFLKE